MVWLQTVSPEIDTGIVFKCFQQCKTTLAIIFNQKGLLPPIATLSGVLTKVWKNKPHWSHPMCLDAQWTTKTFYRAHCDETNCSAVKVIAVHSPTQG